MKTVLITTLIVAIVGVAGLSATADLQYVNSILDLTPLFMPQAIQLVSPPANVTLPTGASGTPGYGVIPLNGQGFPVLLMQSKDAVTLYVRHDSNAPFTLIPWTSTFPSGQRVAEFSVEVSYTSGREPYKLLAIWDPGYPSVLVYARDCYRAGEITLNGKKYKIAVVDENTNGRYDDLANGALFIDINQDGKLLTTRDSNERFTLASPFNLGGKAVYAVKSVSADGAHIVIEKSAKWVPFKPSLAVGAMAPDFTGTTTTGAEISLSKLRGKIVVLDFWASWCAPCVAELPHVKALADQNRSNGLVVLGINLDRTRDAFITAVNQHKLDYPQIYDGASGHIAELYRITAIPMTYIIDRDGKIIAKGIRGDALYSAVKKALAATSS